MGNSQWRLSDYSCLLYRHARYIFTLAGVIMGSGVCFVQEYFFIQPQMKKNLWVLIILSIGLTGLMAGNMIQKLYWEADTDPLTRLGNRRRFNRRLTDEIKLIRKTQQSSILALVDIDNFKRINDTAGHNAGDQVLVRISTIFRENVGPSDSIIRWGGDEFAFVLRGSNVGEARMVIERIREQIHDDPLVHEITISAGLTEIKAQMNLDQILNQADYLLSEAKQMKNSIVI